jgi:hypothetical protein
MAKINSWPRVIITCVQLAACIITRVRLATCIFTRSHMWPRVINGCGQLLIFFSQIYIKKKIVFRILYTMHNLKPRMLSMYTLYIMQILWF